MLNRDWRNPVSCRLFGDWIAPAVLVLAATLASESAARAADAKDLLFPQQVAERHGLTRAWYAQVPVANGRSRVNFIVQDEGLLLVQTSSAMVYAFDTESGHLAWSAEVGDARLPSQRPGANGRPADLKDNRSEIDKLLGHESDKSDKALSERNDKVVAVVNGSALYLLNRADGSAYVDPKNNVEWKVGLRGAPSSGPLVTDNMVIVPNVDGQLECYPTYDSKVSPLFMASSGLDETPPIAVGERIAWASARGVVHITQPKSINVRYRVETTGPITAAATSHDPVVFAGSVDGYLYAINSTTGDVLWKQTVGSAIRQPPVPIRTAVFAVLEDGGLFRGAMSDGHQQWINPAPKFFLAASPTKIYAADEFGHLLVLNAKTGATIDSMAMPSLCLPMANEQTDRIYLTSESGLIQCLHETQLEKPENYLPPKPEKAVEEAPKAKPKAAPSDDPDKPKAEPAPKAVPKPKADVPSADPVMPKVAPEKKAPIPRTPKVKK